LAGPRIFRVPLGKAITKATSSHPDHLEEAPMRDEREGACKTFVVATPGLGVTRPVKLFRTYDNPLRSKSADECTIWEASLATSCVPTFFPKFKVDGIVYADGGIRHNNPSRLILKEAQTLWGPDYPVGCLISLGTGRITRDMVRVRQDSSTLDLVKHLVDLATDCEQVHQDLKRDPLIEAPYYRFNPTIQGEPIQLSSWDKLDVFDTQVASYMESMGGRVKEAASALQKDS